MARERIFGAPDGDLAISVAIETRMAKRVMDFGERGFAIPGYEFHPGTTVPGFYPRYDVSVQNEGRVAIAISTADGVLYRGIAAGVVSDEPDRIEIDRLVRAALANAARS